MSPAAAQMAPLPAVEHGVTATSRTIWMLSCRPIEVPSLRMAVTTQLLASAARCEIGRAM